MSDPSPDDPVAVLDLGDGRDASAAASVGDRIEIRVHAPGGTGYEWELNAGDGRCRVVSRDVSFDEATFGGAGIARFVVEATAGGTADLRLSLQAPWEKQPARTLRVSVKVAE